jgi:hypothetical protein
LAAHELRDAGAAAGKRDGLLCLRTFARGVAAAAAGAAATSANASFKHVPVTAAAAAAADGSGEGLHVDSCYHSLKLLVYEHLSY